MDKEKWNDISKIMKSVELEFDEMQKFCNDDRTCVICESLIMNVHHGPCGCLYCLECITKYLNEGKKICPGNTDVCKNELLDINKNVSIDEPTNRKISNMIVKCPYCYCNQKIKLRNIANHLTKCNFRSVDCPYAIIGCKGYNLAYKDINNHFSMETASHAEILLQFVDSIQNEIKSLKDAKVELENNNLEVKEKLKENENKYDEGQRNAENLEREIKILRVEIESMKKETAENKESINDLKLKCENKSNECKVERRQLEEELRAQKESIERSTTKLEQENREMKERIQEVEKKCDERKEYICEIEKKQMDERIKEVEKKCDKRKESINDLKLKCENKSIECKVERRQLEEELRAQKESIERSTAKLEQENREMKERIQEVEKKCDERKELFDDLKLEWDNKSIECKVERIQLAEELAEQKVSNVCSTKQFEQENRERKEIIEKIEKKCDKRKRKSASKIDGISKLITHLESLSTESDKSISQLKNEMKVLQMLKEKGNCGEFIWRIDKWGEKSKETWIDSDAFYSHRNGYKLSLTVYPNGKEDAIGNHLSIECFVMRGECDDILPWPFKHSVTFELINQHMTQIQSSSTITYGDQYQRKIGIKYNKFNRKTGPINEKQLICSNLRFASLKDLINDENNVLVKNNQIFIRCRVHVN